MRYGGEAMLKKSFPNVFPLHLAPIDSFYCADDGPRYPMTSIIQLDFSGEMDELSFTHGLVDALYRHPLLSSLIQPAKRNMPCWVPTEEVRPRIDWGPLEQPIGCPREQILLDREVGLRFWVRVGQGRTRLTVQVHHACTDGTGVYRFLGDLLAFYGQRTAAAGDPLPRLGDVDPRLLRNRRMSMVNQMGQAKASKVLFDGLREIWNIFGKRIRPLAQPNGTSSQPLTAFPGVQTIVLDKDQHKSLRQFASQHGAMMNDLLMAEMFRTIVRWNRSEKQHRDHDWLRIMMPSDLREVAHHEMPAANMTAYTFVTRRARECDVEIQGLLRSMRDETLRIKRERSGSRFVDAIMLNEYFPKGLPCLLHSGRCIATTTLSNVGDPSKRFSATFPREAGNVVCGNLVLEDVTGVPPLRDNLHATLAVFTYARRLTICVRCDPYRFNPADGQRFLEMFRDGLLSHLPARQLTV